MKTLPMTSTGRRKIARAQAEERFRELRANGVDYLRARDASGLGKRWGDTYAGWAGIDETEFTTTERRMREIIRDVGVRCGKAPVRGSLEAVRYMAQGIADQATGRARLRLRAGYLG